ncbi:hypothetical protein BU24DRAFT_415142 [Aaosphaeria arxii CBS 175.79]|uniref:Uncharacterized protein n=1 Tax=Aaosphaeria arxii CBS 175.79 TaxID=1450172 RepID=A0A6A5X8S4_9PLEO|nr:uncharacterized protein BU24DRAFT_415142 [Aaosphaeria arxii CBS 175.79]KAF2009207.1 hypothetical protein BU24DRAFT_415142 [Aaosphaeria arxii CBS 175.79]
MQLIQATLLALSASTTFAAVINTPRGEASDIAEVNTASVPATSTPSTVPTDYQGDNLDARGLLSKDRKLNARGWGFGWGFGMGCDDGYSEPEWAPGKTVKCVDHVRCDWNGNHYWKPTDKNEDPREQALKWEQCSHCHCTGH